MGNRQKSTKGGVTVGKLAATVAVAGATLFAAPAAIAMADTAPNDPANKIGRDLSAAFNQAGRDGQSNVSGTGGIGQGNVDGLGRIGQGNVDGLGRIGQGNVDNLGLILAGLLGSFQTNGGSTTP